MADTSRDQSYVWILLNDKKSYGATRLKEEAEKMGCKVSVYKTQDISVLTSASEDPTILVKDRKTTIPDVVLCRTGASTNFHGFAVIELLEQKGVIVANSSKAIANCKDKLHMMQMFSKAHLPVPKTMLMQYPSSIKRIQSEIGFPLVIKMVSGAKGFGVHLCESPRALQEILEIISSQIQHNPIIMQEYIGEKPGEDIRVFVSHGQVLSCIKRSSPDGFKANYSRGGRVERYPLTPEIENLALEASRLCELDYGGIDLLFSEGGYKICEANSSPGFEGVESVDEMNVAQHILTELMARLERKSQIELGVNFFKMNPRHI